MTQKEARGGDKKWKLTHLPPRTQEMFSEQLVPYARSKAGTLGPWEPLSVKDIQELVNDTFGEGVYTVTEDNVWFGLVRPFLTQVQLKTNYSIIVEIGYRLANWRNGFGAAAIDSVKQMIKDNEERLRTPEDVQEYVQACLQEVPIKPGSEVLTAAFHWKEWNGGEKKKVSR
jgi:hypothetical protein